MDELTRPTAKLGGLSLAELPLPDHRPFPVPFNPSYAILIGMPYFRWGVRRVARRGLPLVLLFHLIDFARPLRRGALPGLRARAYTLSTHSQPRKLRRCQAVLDEIHARFELLRTDDLLARLA